MTEEEMAALLGRPLTPVEVGNFDLYLEIANMRIEELLCTTLAQETAEREYDARRDYRTLFTDIFTAITAVEIDGTIIDIANYSLRQWDRRNQSWYNSLVFNTTMGCDSVKVTGTWGFETLPADLSLLIARMFDLVGKENKLDREINSKKIEDFTISYNHSSITMSDTPMESFLKDNVATIDKYSLCNIGEIRNGRVSRIYC